MKKGGLLERFMLAIVPVFAALLMRLIHRLNRCEILDEEGLAALRHQGRGVILSFWHEQLFLMIFAYHGPGGRALVSNSRDGELLARIMAFFGLGVVRGSSRRGGRAAFREMVQIGKGPLDLILTPDGPTGPRRELKDGIVELARITGRPVVPLCFVSSRGHRFSSWDRFFFPYPFGRGVFAYGEAIQYLPGEENAVFKDRILTAMNANEAKAIARLESYGLRAL
ncbi:MAG: lysophospholipid acyltransferase family protein [Desulfuromonadales bacterium]|nr:lysophospholipid acyltransferase family protein [Desulfuromonadales bacterium]